MNALTLPDVAAQAARQALPLEWVGMCGIALPVFIEGQRLAAKADAGVSLDDGDARGIHMSRLYLGLEAMEQQNLSPALLRQVLQRFLDSHEDLSEAAYLNIHIDLLLRRPALVSPLAGWKNYPVTVSAQLKNKVFHVELKIDVAYSSTCPCSAALARQLIQQQFVDDFANKPLQHADVLAWLGSTQGIVATPHSQRSTAQLHLHLDEFVDELPLTSIINDAEAALGTAVQTAVKRADEQAFALANGQNLMFCEDAARRLNLALRGSPGISQFHVRVIHAESLHAHDAVAESHWRREQP
ncbi:MULTISPECIES: GTP cyclohydrolase FolE2 [Pseudomonas]|uniref:GTP cyclohydrolase FolE2 n=1 Tax=Pseudomonas fluorescens (strain Pf0-1) TaxID=205922 RepID=GCH4_PSEPF|nr:MULTISPECIES: GTP cyclohydrolase FolE2 [Pseudomonas]Q3K4B0.1 RecName: Full=GTP cyclohydrolase FolE2 [Pseudomonas fluorescens Pf0-1]ABA77394.1 GTP cyclohydrolase I [Pseudomonas fluorescens Pf0-1]MBL0798122.1 GTP cyclohydrolase I FolE2 [Pseudomonas sp. B7]MBX8624842.1 GTP cyclohydrolase FolE2 [Pseudomonas glycinae]MBY9022586.1 GTP cyclohydrolase FolE2 [Pseudomonas fluorescens]MBY9028578.1 GTP cyclohydrolase FolE2 [Pseudomonas fluorescens]